MTNDVILSCMTFFLLLVKRNIQEEGEETLSVGTDVDKVVSVCVCVYAVVLL